MAEFVEVVNKKRDICKYYTDNSKCSECPLFSAECANYITCANAEEVEKIIMDWKKPVNWSKVKVDTPILVRHSDNDEWTKRHFAKLGEDGGVFAWIDGKTSYTASRYELADWKYAKLAEDGE